MARINVDTEFLCDPRLTLLSQDIPRYQAIGAIIALWELGQSYWKKNKALIPLDIFPLLPHTKQLLQFGFCEVHEDGIYCKGAEERWSFLLARAENGKRGGRSRAKTGKRDVLGHFVPNEPKQTARQTQANCQANPSKPRHSSSSSSSSSIKQRKKEKHLPPQTLENEGLLVVTDPVSAKAFLSEQTKSRIVQLYPEPDFLKAEFLKMDIWLECNPRRVPKCKGGWTQFIMHWLRKGWNDYRKTIPSNKPGASENIEMRWD